MCKQVVSVRAPLLSRHRSVYPILCFEFRGRKLLSAPDSSYVTVSEIQVIDTNLAVKRLGLTEEEEVK